MRSGEPNLHGPQYSRNIWEHDSPYSTPSNLYIYPLTIGIFFTIATSTISIISPIGPLNTRPPLNQPPVNHPRPTAQPPPPLSPQLLHPMHHDPINPPPHPPFLRPNSNTPHLHFVPEVPIDLPPKPNLCQSVPDKLLWRREEYLTVFRYGCHFGTYSPDYYWEDFQLRRGVGGGRKRGMRRR